MRALKRFLKRLVASAMQQGPEERMKEEVEEHLALQTADNLRAGLSPVEARRQAMLKFGAIAAIEEDYRAQRGLPFLETLLQDARHALRRLRKSPAFTVTATLTLALGIGATTSIFTLVHAVLLKSLPVVIPDQLFRLGKEPDCCVEGGYFAGNDYSLVSYELYKLFATIRGASKRWRGFRPTEPFSGFGVPTTPIPPGVTSGSLYPTVISQCSA